MNPNPGKSSCPFISTEAVHTGRIHMFRHYVHHIHGKDQCLVGRHPVRADIMSEKGQNGGDQEKKYA